MKLYKIFMLPIFFMNTVSASAQEFIVKINDLKGNLELIQTISDINSGTEVGVYSLNSGGIWTCLGRNSYKWGVSRTNAITMEFDLAFRNALESRDIIKSFSNNDIFHKADPKKYQIAAVVKKLDFDMCLDSKGSKPKGRADLEIEVNIFSVDASKIMYSKKFTGKFLTEERIDSTQFILLQKAFSDALGKFFTDIASEPKVNSPPTTSSTEKNNIEKSKEICLGIGLKLGTDKFSDCYLETLKKM